MYTEDIGTVIESVVQSLNFEVVITDMQVNGDGTISLLVCDLYYAEPGRVVTISGNNYIIRSIDDSTNTMVLMPGQPIMVDRFQLYPVYFFQGTPYDTEKQIRDIPKAENKTPMVFLLIPYTEKEFLSLDSAYERTGKYSFFFLTQANFDSMSTDDLLGNAVRPMRRLKERFFGALIADTARFDMHEQELDYTPRLKFGVYVGNAGVKKAFAAMDLSGVQTDCTLSLYHACGADPDCA